MNRLCLVMHNGKRDRSSKTEGVYFTSRTKSNLG